MTSNRKCPVPSVLLCIVCLFLTTIVACYFVFKLTPKTPPTTVVTNPVRETKAAWAEYDSSGMDASAKDTRFEKDSMLPFAWKDFTVKYPADWHFTEEMFYYAESPMPATSFYDDKGDFKLSIVFGSAIVQPEQHETEEVKLGGKTFYRYVNEARRSVYIFKSGNDDEIFMGTAVQIDLELADMEESISKAVLESFTLIEDADHSTFNMANIDLNANPCIGTTDGDRKQAMRDSIGYLYGYLATRDYSEAAALLNSEDSDPFGNMFGVCSAYHGKMAAVAGRNGVILITSSGNGLPSVPNDTYYFGYMTAADDIITLHEDLIKHYFDDDIAVRYRRYLASPITDIENSDLSPALELIKTEETRTKKEFMAGAFSDPYEQEEYETFVAKYDSTK